MTTAIFAGRTALVTGGSRGIGRAIVQMLAEHGAKVAINYQHNAEAAQEILAQVESCGTEGMAVQADVSQQAEVEQMIAQVRAAFGPVELLVNNAGIAYTQEHGEFGFAEWDRMFAVNVHGPFLTTWAVKDEMIARRFGRIVNISSLAALAAQAEHDPLRYDEGSRHRLHSAMRPSVCRAQCANQLPSAGANGYRAGALGQPRPSRRAHRQHSAGTDGRSGGDGVGGSLFIV